MIGSSYIWFPSIGWVSFITLAILPFVVLATPLAFKVGALIESFDRGTDKRVPWPAHNAHILDFAKSNVLKEHDVNLSWTFIMSSCNTKQGLIQTVLKVVPTDQEEDNRVDGFIGPGCSEVCKNAAYIVSKEGFNVPMISYSCTLDSLSNKEDYSTFARTVSSIGAFAVPMIELVQHMKWERIGIIYRNILLYEEAAAKIKKTLETKFGNDTGSDMPYGFNVVCYKVWYFVEDDDISDMKRSAVDILNECQDEVRVFLILAYDSEVIKFLEFAYEEPSFPYAESAFITLEVTSTGVVNSTQAYTRGLLSLTQKHPANSMFQSLTDHVRTAAGDSSIKLDVFSATLYDSLLTYAMAAKKIKDDYYTAHTSQSDSDKIAAVTNLVKNGTGMAKAISELETFEGASGQVKFDDNADRRASVEVLQAQVDTTTNSISMVRIFDTDSDSGKLVIVDGTVLQWNDGSSDIPPACGKDRELCKDKDMQATILLVTIPVGVALLIIVIVLVFFLLWRNKVQRSRDRSLWKIRTSEVEFKDATQSGRFQSLRIDRSMSRMSTHSDASLMNHGIVAYYKNNPIFLKYLNTDIKSFNVTEETIIEFKQVRELSHQNLNPYIGACVEVPDNFFLASLYLRKGSLQDILCDSNLKLGIMFKMSFIFDVCKGMQAIHHSPIKFHGRLKSCNCVVDAHWVLKITDYGLLKFLSSYSLTDPIKSEDGKYFDLLWTAPELLREMDARDDRFIGSQKGDIYSCAIIITEIMSTNTPYGDINCSAKEIVTKVKEGYSLPFRPDMPLECTEGMSDLIAMCWHDNPALRPDFHKILGFLQVLHPQKQRSITDRMIKMMEQYTDNLEELVAERSEQLAIEKEKADNLLCRMLPQPIAEKLKQGEPVSPQAFEEVTIYFSDIVGFTDLSGQSTPFQVVDLLNDLYSLFDGIVERHDVYKVETIGDAYMVVSGLPVRNGQRHVAEIANMSLDFLNSVQKFKVRHKPQHQLLLRIGMHTGSVCAGVVGLKMPRYCLFGDTVNTASRMESNGLPLKIHMSESAFTALEKIGGYEMESRGEISIKGKGMMKTWFLTGKKLEEIDALITTSNQPSPPSSPQISTKTSVKDFQRLNSRRSLCSMKRQPSKHSIYNNSMNSLIDDVIYKAGGKTLSFKPHSVSLGGNEIHKNSLVGDLEKLEYKKCPNNGYFPSSNA